MTEQNPKIDGRTLYAGKIALAKKQISAASFRALEEGRLSLADARELGRDRGPDDTGQDTIRATEVQDGGREVPRSASAEHTDAPQYTPPQPVSRISKDDQSRLCMCACGNRTRGGRFLPGHDVRLLTYAKEYLRGERELTEEQMAYVRESGKLDRARTRLAEEERKRQERVARKTDRQRRKEGETEAMRRNEALGRGNGGRR